MLTFWQTLRDQRRPPLLVWMLWVNLCSWVANGFHLRIKRMNYLRNAREMKNSPTKRTNCFALLMRTFVTFLVAFAVVLAWALNLILISFTRASLLVRVMFPLWLKAPEHSAKLLHSFKWQNYLLTVKLYHRITSDVHDTDCKTPKERQRWHDVTAS